MKIFIALLIATPSFASAQDVDASDILFLKIQELEGEIASLRSELESQGYLLEKLLSEEIVQADKLDNNDNLSLSEAETFRFEGINDSKSIEEVYDEAITNLNEKDFYLSLIHI